MRKLATFNTITLDGFFTAPGGDMSWAHAAPEDKEWNDFVAGNASHGGALVLGRVTYDMMASYWPTPQAKRDMPAVAKGMNEMRKVVYSKTLNQSPWSNTVLVNEDPATSMKQMKSEAGPPMTILGSGTIVSQLARAGLIDEYQLVIRPIAIGKGRSLFDGVANPLNMRLKASRTFSNGNVWLSYEPAA